MWKQLGISHDQFIRTTDDAAQGRRPRADRAHLRAATRTTSTRRRTRAGTASGASRSSRTPRSSTASACCIRRARWSGSRSATGSSGSASTRTSCSALIARAAGVPAARESRATRCSRCSIRGSRTFRPAGRASRGAFPSPAPLSTGETQTTYVWFDALPNYLTATGFPTPGCERRVARAAARHRQGHHALPRDHLAGDAAGGRAAAARTGVGARLRAARRRAVQQVGRRAARPRRGDRPLRRRRVPLFPAARGAVRRRRQLLVGALRGALQHRPRERVGQSREPRDRDGRAVLRRRSSPRARAPTWTRATRPSSREYHAAMDGTRGFLLHEALRDVWRASRAATSTSTGRQPWKLAKDPALRTELETTLAALVRQLARHAVHRRAVHARQGAGTVGAARRTAATGGSALRTPCPRSTRRDGRCGRGIRSSRKKPAA